MTGLLDQLRSALPDRYEIRDELGRGGMAIVFLAHDRKHDRPVAIKVLRPELASSVGPDRFLREIRIAAQLSHPRILQVFDSGDAAGLLYYVMPLVEGESLRDRLEREVQLPVDEAIRIACDVAAALSHAHSHGVIHRDIKPENILLYGGEPIVADFGIARAVLADDAARLTETGLAIGTPAYMSPEQALGERPVDHRADIYALGCVLYEMLVGEPPFTGPSAQVLLARKAVEPVPRLSTVRDSVPQGLETAVLKALARTPADRFATAHQFAEALRTALGSGLVPSPTQPPKITWRPRHVVAAIAVVAALTGTLVAVRLSHPGPGGLQAGATRTTLAVFPFRALGVEAAQWSEALGDLLATALDGTPDLTVADPWSLWRSLRPEPGAPARSPDAAEASELAVRAGANQFVLATVVGAGGQLQVTLRTYAVGNDEALRTLTDAAPADSLLTFAQRLAVGIITTVMGEGAERGSAALLDRVNTRSVGALKAYLDAREAMRRGQVADANRAINRALALDSTFGLALIEAPVIKSWAQFIDGRPYPNLLDLAERAVARSAELSERSRLRSRAVLASILTRGADAADAAGRMLRIDSTDFDAWTLLAYAHQAYGWQYGATIADAVRAADQVVTLDPTYIPGLVVRAELAASLADTGDARRQLERLRHADTTKSLVRGTILGLELLLTPRARYASRVADLPALPIEEWIPAYRLVRFADPSKAEILGAAFRGSTTVPRARLVASAELLRLWLAQGRLLAVDSAIATRQLGDSTLERTLDRFLVAASIAGLLSPEDVRRAALALSADVPLDSAVSLVDDRAVIETGWVLAASNAVHGDRAVARRWQRAFDAMPPGGVQRDYRGALRADIESRLAVREGHLTEGLALARQALELWAVHVNSAFEDNPEIAMRFHLADLFRRAGQPDSAAALLRSLVPPTSWSGFYTPLAALALGQIAAETGDGTGAAWFFRMASNHWQRSDPRMAAWLGRAADGLTGAR